jgi:hypothetical protein
MLIDGSLPEQESDQREQIGVPRTRTAAVRGSSESSRAASHCLAGS